MSDVPESETWTQSAEIRTYSLNTKFCNKDEHKRDQTRERKKIKYHSPYNLKYRIGKRAEYMCPSCKNSQVLIISKNNEMGLPMMKLYMKKY